MNDDSMYDVIIIGGGLVGATLACALQALPLKIAILEAKAWSQEQQPPSYDDRVLALNYASQQILQAIGLWSALAPEATAIRQIHVSDKNHFGFSRIDNTVLQVPALGYVLPARQLGYQLYQRLTAVELLAPAQLQHIQCHAEHIEIQVNTQQQQRHLSTRLLVAADGQNSQIRQQLGIAMTQRDYGQTAIIANVTLTQPHCHTAYERFTASGPLALLPLKSPCNCGLVWSCSAQEAENILSLSESDFLAALQKHFGWRLGQFIQVGQRHAYPLQLLRAQQLVQGRVVIIGNAAHTLHPVAAQGFNLGLRDVAHLAEVIADSWQLYHDVGVASALQRYVAWQQPDIQQMSTLTDTLVRLFTQAHWPFRLARNVGLLAMDALSPLKKQLACRLAGLKTRSGRLTRGLTIDENHSFESE